MTKQTFGFTCGQFSIACSDNYLVFPGAENQYIKKSLLPGDASDGTEGMYTLDVKSGGDSVYQTPVYVMWVAHPSQPEPFMGLKGQDSQDLGEFLASYEGQPVELVFTPLKKG